MNTYESELLFSAIASHLSTSRPQPVTPERDFTYWDGRTRITAAQMEILIALMSGPLSAETLALHLGRSLAVIDEPLEALSAKGIVERRGDGYAVTPATALYLQAIAPSLRPRTGEN